MKEDSNGELQSEQGDAAPRLNDVALTPEQARAHHVSLLTEVVRMLCAGVVHGDLSEFNILLAHMQGLDGAEGVDEPVIIDLPQAVDAAGNNHAQRMLLRDVANLRDFFGQFAPELAPVHHMPADAVGAAQQGLHVLHAALAQGVAHRLLGAQPATQTARRQPPPDQR
mgnify:CR=1 FL=1